jgi:hypothetical protein
MNFNEKEYTEEEIRELCAPVIDVQYVIGLGIGKTFVETQDKLVAIAELYHTYKSEVFEDEQGKHPYIAIDVDENNVTFARLDTNYIKKARKIDCPKEPRPTAVSLRKNILRNAKNIADPDSIDACKNLDDISLTDIVEDHTNENANENALYSICNESGNIEFIIPEGSGVVQYGNVKPLHQSDFDALQNLMYLINKSTCHNCLFEKYDTMAHKISNFYKN